MLENLHVVLVRPKYPENVGAAARACLNMGCPNLSLVAPRGYDPERALPMATAHARHILDSAALHGDLAQALAPATLTFGTTARTGGWRRGVLHPSAMAEAAVAELARGGRVALVFGPEDTGLENDETQLCGGLVHVPTAREGTSLNLAQAVMICLWECFSRRHAAAFTPGDPATERGVTHAESEALMGSLQETLEAIDFLKDQNADYWMLPVRRFFAKVQLKRGEFNMLMGICRQMRWIAGKAGR